MKEWPLKFALHAIWSRREAAYYAVSLVSIAGNFVVLVAPSLQTFILSQSGALPVVSTLGLLQSLPRAYIRSSEAASVVGALQAPAWNALTHLAELVLQRSVLYVVLNLIVASIVVKSGMYARRASMVASAMKQENSPPIYNFQGLSGSHSWLAPSYLNTVCSTIANFADVSTNPTMHVHSRGGATVADTQAPLMQDQQHQNISFFHDDQGLQVVPAPTIASPTAAPPSLFTIEPLDELVLSMASQPARHVNAKVSSPPLKKVATKGDLLQAVRQRRRKKSKPEGKKLRLQKAGRVAYEVENKHGINEVKDKHGIRRKKQQGETHHTRGVVDESGVQTKVHLEHTVMHCAGEFGVQRYNETRDSELSRQEFNERVDTFISKFKRNLTMQRNDSLNRLLGLY